MKEVLNKKSSIGEIIEMHQGTHKAFGNLLKKIKIENPCWNDMSDARIISVKLINENLQTNIILLNLIKENFSNLGIWKFQDFSNTSKTDFLNNRLHFVLGDLKSLLLVKVFMNYEHFIRLIANRKGLKSDSINDLSKNIVSILKLNGDYENLIDILTYSRNTVHFGGIHTKIDKSVTYKSKTYNFIKDEHLSFFDDDTFHYFLQEIGRFFFDIINSDDIKKESEIIHTYSGFKFTYE